jgi:inner membrane protein
MRQDLRRAETRRCAVFITLSAMPSPVGHAIAGVASGWIVRGNHLSESTGSGRREAALFAALGMLADVDLLFGIHSGPTHGLGAAAVAAAAAWLPWFSVHRTPDRLQFALACVLAYASHTLLDWLGTDTSAPIGIMALWPFSREYYESGLHVFMAVSRRVRHPELFWAQNITAVIRELAILAPIAAVIGIRRCKRPTSNIEGN